MPSIFSGAMYSPVVHLFGSWGALEKVKEKKRKKKKKRKNVSFFSFFSRFSSPLLLSSLSQPPLSFLPCASLKMFFFRSMIFSLPPGSHIPTSPRVQPPFVVQDLLVCSTSLW